MPRDKKERRIGACRDTPKRAFFQGGHVIKIKVGELWGVMWRKKWLIDREARRHEIDCMEKEEIPIG